MGLAPLTRFLGQRSGTCLCGTWPATRTGDSTDALWRKCVKPEAHLAPHDGQAPHDIPQRHEPTEWFPVTVVDMLPIAPTPRIGIGPRESAPRTVRACPVGPSGIPSCTLFIDAGCATGDGETLHDVRIADAGLGITEKPRPAATLFWACETSRTSPIPLVFP